MARELAIGLVIGGAVSKSVGTAFKDVEGRVKRLESTASKARVLQSVISETKQLQAQWRAAHREGTSAAEGVRRKLENNLHTLRQQGVEVRDLGRAYQQLGAKARSAELKATGHAQLKQGGASLRNTAAVTAGVAATTMIAPAKVSANYGATIRDIAIKAGIAKTPAEQQVSQRIIETSRSTGMARDDVADVVNGLVGAGMELKEALEYAPVASKFVVGQGVDGADTAKMINALQQNAKITDPEDMQKALEAIAFQGQAGSFEAGDMAKWFPELLAGMAKLGIEGNDAVVQLGSMLQVQMKTAGSADGAANNLKNWMEKIGTTDVVKAYENAGIDYQKSLNTGLQNGMSTLEASFALAQRYVEATNPKQAKAMSDAMDKIGAESDPQKAQKMMTSLEQALRTGDLFADMQVKAALTAYTQNKQLYQEQKKASAEAAGILDKNLNERRETSAQQWKESSQAMDDVMRSAGDAMRPLTDSLAAGLTSVATGIAAVTDESPALVNSLLGVGAAIATVSAAYSAFKIGKGLMNIGRGTLMGNPNIVQKVAVVSGLVTEPVPSDGRSRKGRSKRSPRPNRPVPKSASTPAKPRLRIYAQGGSKPSAPLSSWKPPTSTVAASPPLLNPIARPSAPPTSALKILGKANLAATVISSALDAKAIYDSDGTQTEKAEGYGTAAGGLAGTLAGAAAGAAIGSVVPVIGTAIGGLIGGVLGNIGGGTLGGIVGKSVFGGPDRSDIQPEERSGPTRLRPRLGPAVPKLTAIAESFEASPSVLVKRDRRTRLPAFNDVSTSLTDAPDKAPVLVAKPTPEATAPHKASARPNSPKITLAPKFNIVIQGDAKNPQELVNQMMPEIERRLKDTALLVSRRSMTDSPAF